MKQLYFVRHGQSQANLDRVFGGRSNTPLTQVGKKEALTAGKEARKLGISHIVSSPLERARETAEIIAQQIGFPAQKIEFNNLFMERDYGSLTGMSFEADFDLDGMIDIETIDSIQKRGRLAYKHLQTLDDDIVLVVSHGTFGKALRSAIYPHLPFADDDELKNAKVIKLI